jgi:hypothetical protein
MDFSAIAIELQREGLVVSCFQGRMDAGERGTLTVKASTAVGPLPMLLASGRTAVLATPAAPERPGSAPSSSTAAGPHSPASRGVSPTPPDAFVQPGVSSGESELRSDAAVADSETDGGKESPAAGFEPESPQSDSSSVARPRGSRVMVDGCV